MSNRHVPTRRLHSGVLFSAPGETQRVPPDETSLRLKRRKPDNIRRRIADVQHMEPVDDLSSCSSPMPEHQVSLAMFAKYDGDLNNRSSTKSRLWEGSRPPKEEKVTLCLPILKVSSTTMIEGTLARTTVIQSFHNPSQANIDEAQHRFPLYDGATVTDFECTIGDERRLRGVVKSKEQAREEYKKAVQEQVKAAALLEEHTPEIFETSLGNIPPVTKVEIKIVYIQVLNVVMMEGEATEGVAFIIPTSIAPRYSQSQPVSEIACKGLDIKIMVLNDGKVNPDGCQEESGHIVYYDGPQIMESLQSFNDNGEQSLQSFYCWDHHSDQPTLRKDFVFVIQMKECHEVQSQAILCPPDDAGLAAMMVSIRPTDLFRNAIMPQSFSGEIVFLLDQSGSMGERVGRYDGPNKIDVLREAMLLVVSGLPKTCSFNIVSWGSETWAMWEQSREHSPDNIKEAKEYISQIDANFGGTDLLRAFKSTVQRRRDNGGSTQVVVLTDGELNASEPVEFVWKTRQELQNKVRFFALGIGDNVPHSLIESIAELGGGFGDIVDITRNPRWHGRLNRLFKSSLEPDSWSCDIDIGHEFERHKLMDLKLNRDTADLQRVPYFQTPHTIATLHPFKFTSIFFLIDVKDRDVLPSEVTVITTTHGAKKKTYKLPVQHTTGGNGTLHRLAAKAALVDLEDIVKRDSSCASLVDKNAQTIGTRYSITSKWTSFVAIPRDEPTSNPTATTTTEGCIMEHYKAIYDGVNFNKLSTTADSDTDDDMIHDRSLPVTYTAISRAPTLMFDEDLVLEGRQTLTSPPSASDRVDRRVGLPSRRKSTRKAKTVRSGCSFESGEPRCHLSGSTCKVKGENWPSPRTLNPLNWEIVIEYQNGQGLFELPESVTGLLYLHFCPNTALVVVARLEEAFTSQGQEQIVSKAVLVDTIMTIRCYQTHLALEEDIWDLMMERARDAVAEAIGRDTLERLEVILNAAMMHEHYRAATGANGNEGGGFTSGVSCPVCDINWQSSRKFFCPFDHEPGMPHAFGEWAEFWEHQMEKGHMVCPRESTGG